MPDVATVISEREGSFPVFFEHVKTGAQVLRAWLPEKRQEAKGKRQFFPLTVCFSSVR